MMCGPQQTTPHGCAADGVRRRRGESQSPLRQIPAQRQPETPDSVRLYLREIGRIPLLSAADEVRLAHAIEVGVLAEERLDSRPTRLDWEDRFDLTYLADAGQQAKATLVQSNLRLVVAVAKRYGGSGHLAARPGPGRQHRPDPGGREVRLPARLQVLDVRDLVDPAGDLAWPRRPVAHDPGAGPRGRGDAPRAAGAAGDVPAPGPQPDDRRARRGTLAADARAHPGPAQPGRRADVARPPGRRRRERASCPT